MKLFLTLICLGTALLAAPAEVRMAIQPFFTTTTYPTPVRSAALMALFAHGATKEELTTLVAQLAAAGEAEGTLNGFRTAIEKMK